jgi:FKBP-type peptidyl-prolyl cis-trans isomerase FkpA
VAEAPAEPACEPETPTLESVEIAAGLTSLTTAHGCGRSAEPGDLAEVHYTGWLFDAEAEDNRGEKFDSSVDRGQAFSFPLGAGRVIKGWDQGVAGMQIGETRILTIAPDMAYGDRDRGPIPANSTLIFEVELLGLTGPGE